jgi:hypothetical protein
MVLSMFVRIEKLEAKGTERQACWHQLFIHEYLEIIEVERACVDIEEGMGDATSSWQQRNFICPAICELSRNTIRKNIAYCNNTTRGFFELARRNCLSYLQLLTQRRLRFLYDLLVLTRQAHSSRASSKHGVKETSGTSIQIWRSRKVCRLSRDTYDHS